MTWLVWTMMLMLSSALHGCESAPPPPNGSTITADIAGKKYNLEIAATNDVRMKGLGGRTSIPEDGGMIFAFPSSQVRPMGFVMRDCPIGIDILYLDGAGRVLSMYEMTPEPPRGPDEGKEGEFTSEKYEKRLKQYPSKFPCTFAVELRAGSIKKLGVKEGDKVVFDTDALKRMAK